MGFARACCVGYAHIRCSVLHARACYVLLGCECNRILHEQHPQGTYEQNDFVKNFTDKLANFISVRTFSYLYPPHRWQQNCDIAMPIKQLDER